MNIQFVGKQIVLGGVTALALSTVINWQAKAASITERLPLANSASAGQANDFSYITVAKPGQKFALKQAVVKGKYTIVDFQSKYCPDCLKMKPLLLNLTKVRPDIAVRLVDIDRSGFKGIDWKSPVATQYRIHDIPQFKLFGPNGALIGQGDAAMDEVIACLSKELPRQKKPNK